MNGTSVLSPVELKKAVVRALEDNDYGRIVAMARQSRGVLSLLVRLAYDKETLIGWRSILAIGKISSVFVNSKDEHEFLRVTIRKLLWMLSDESGGIGWAAPEMLGEIVRADPAAMSDIIPLIAELYSVEEKVFRPGVLYALKRIAEKHSELVQPYQEIITKGLSDPDPLTRIYALDLIALLKLQQPSADAVTKKVDSLLSDTTEAWVYRDIGFVGIEVREAAKRCKYALCN